MSLTKVGILASGQKPKGVKAFEWLGYMSAQTINIGPADVDRYIVAVGGMRFSTSGGAPNSIARIVFNGDIEGIVFSSSIFRDALNNESFIVAAGGAYIPTGATMSVQFISNSGSTVGMLKGAYRMIGSRLSNFKSANGDNASASFGAVEKESVVIGVAIKDSKSTACTWALTRNYNTDQGGWQFSCASQYYPAGAGAVNASVTNGSQLMTSSGINSV